MLILHEEGVPYGIDSHHPVKLNAVIADEVAHDFCKSCKSHAAKKVARDATSVVSK